MAARFWIGGGTTTGWDASPTTNWAATSGGTTRVAAPTVSDDVTFDGVGVNGNTVSVLSASNSCLSLTFTTGYTSTITINTGIVLTIAGNFTDRTNHTWVVSGTGSMAISATSTITSNSKTFPGSVSFSGSNTKTLVGDWTITGALTISTSTTTINHTTAEVLSCAGLTMSGALTGNVGITLTGGTWSGAQNCLTSTIQFNIAGNVTFSATGAYSGTFAYTSGTWTQSSTLLISGTTTFNTAGMIWTSINFGGINFTHTINSALTLSGTLTFSGTTGATFAGTAGWSTATFISTATGTTTITLQNSVTYTVTGSFTMRAALTMTVTSNDGTIKATLTLNNGATCNTSSAFTRIDASAGRAINTFNGTVTTCNNVFSFTDALPPAIGRTVGMVSSF